MVQYLFQLLNISMMIYKLTMPWTRVQPSAIMYADYWTVLQKQASVHP